MTKVENLDDFLKYIAEQEATIKRQEHTIKTIGEYTSTLWDELVTLRERPMVKYSHEEVANFEEEIIRVQNLYCGRIRQQDNRIYDLTKRLERVEGAT